MSTTLEYRDTPNGYRVFRGERLVAEILPPLPGRIGDYWYTNLLTKRRGKCQSLDEVKEQLKDELVAYSEAFGRAEAIKVAALIPGGRPSHKITRGRKRSSECPHCELEVPNLLAHLKEIHGIGFATAPIRIRKIKASSNVRPDLIA